MPGLTERLAAVRRNPVLLFAAAYTLSAVVQKGLGFLLFLWFARGLPVAEYALFGLLYSLQTAVAALAMAGIIETTIGGLKHASDEDRRAGLLNSAALVQLMLGCASLVLVPIAFLWSPIFSPAALATAAAGGALTAFFTIQSQLSRIVDRQVEALLIGFIPPMLGLLGGFVGYLVEGTALSFFVGQAAALVLAIPLAGLTRMGLPRLKERSDLGYLSANLGPYILVALVDWFGGYGNTYLVKMFFSAEAVARFVFAYTLSAIMHLVATSMNQAWSPRVFSLIHSNASTLDGENRKFYFVQGCALGLTAAVILFILPVAIDLAGPGMAHYRNLEVEVAILFAAYMLVIPWYHAQNYYYAHASGRALMRITVFSSIAGIGLWVACALLLGPEGAYLGFAAMMVAKMCGGLIGARRRWGLELLWHGPVTGLALLATGLVAGMTVWN